MVKVEDEVDSNVKLRAEVMEVLEESYGKRYEFFGFTEEEIEGNNGSSEIDFTINRDGGNNVEDEETVNKVGDKMEISCKGCKAASNSELGLTEHLQRSFKCIGYNTMCPVCNNYYRGEKGLKIHLARSKCKDGNVEDLIPACCVPSIGSISEVLTCQENIHSTVSQNRELSDLSSLEKLPTRKPIKWPRMSDTKNWSALEDVVDAQLPNRCYVKNGINMIEMVLYEEAEKMFGVVEFKKRKNHMSRRQQKMAETKK